MSARAGAASAPGPADSALPAGRTRDTDVAGPGSGTETSPSSTEPAPATGRGTRCRPGATKLPLRGGSGRTGEEPAPVDDGVGDVCELPVSAAGVGSEQLEGCAFVD